MLYEMQCWTIKCLPNKPV